MKHCVLVLLFIFSLHIGFAEGWRDKEKQILITLESQEQANLIAQMKLSFDYVDYNVIRAYTTPKEINHLELLGISFIVEVEDLNQQINPQYSEEAFHSYQEIIDLADSLVLEYPDICEKHLFGESMGGRQLAALKISDNVSIDEPEAEVFFDGGIHGDEICGPENLIRFARDICIDYGEDPDITDLIDNREIWLYLMVNPDGREAQPRVRYNNNGVDLNRDWGYMWDEWGGSTGAYSQVESKALRECVYNHQFVVHTTYHGGTEYISLPWSYRSSSPPDWDHIYDLGGVYSNTSLYPNMEYGQGNSGMYAINGSTKDSNYGIMGSISWSMEISYDKQPPSSQLIMYYDRNYPAMIAMIEYAGYGLEGIITDAESGEAVTAIVLVEDYLQTYSDPTAGDYHKYVLPGTYSITVMANGYESLTIDNVVVTENNTTATNFELEPATGQYVYKFSASRIPENNESDEGNTKAVFGQPDDVFYSIGKNGWVVLDMQYPIIDGPGFDLIVYENDAIAEGFECFASTTMDGPWVSLGTGTGTSEFDLSMGPIAEAQFIKIVDDGDGSASVNDAGFDLDAIEALEAVSGVYIALFDYQVDDSQGNNNGRIDAGETVDILVNLKNNGDIIAENTSGIITSTSPYVTIDVGTANYGSLGQGQMEQGVYTITANPDTPDGEPVIISMDVTANGGWYSNNYLLGFTIGLIVEDWESGSFDQYEWETGGDNSWSVSMEEPYEGVYCVKSGPIDDESVSFLSISFNVLSAGEVGFFKKVSSESNYDFLKFYIDDSMIGQWSGEDPWSEVSFPVSAGQHTLMWAYETDYSVSAGDDCAWLDFITLPSGAATTILASFSADNTIICEDETVNFADGSMGNIISWDWIFEGGSPATSSFQNPSITYNTAGSYDVSLTVSDGENSNTLIFEDYITVDVCGGVSEFQDMEIEVFPNPATDQLTVQFKGTLSGEYTINLVNNLGKTVIHIPHVIIFENNSKTIDIKNLDAGVYFLIIENKERTRKEKIVVH